MSDTKSVRLSANFDAFARELSKLCRNYGVGISGEPTAFVMERDDYLFDYSIDDDGIVRLGSPRNSPQQSGGINE